MLFFSLFLLTLLMRGSYFVEHKLETQGSLGEIVPSSAPPTNVESSSKRDRDINMFVKSFSHPESTTPSLLAAAIPDESSKKIKEIEDPKESRGYKDFKKSEESKARKKSELVEDTGKSATKEKAEKPKESEDPKECPAESLVCSNPLNETDTKQFDCDLKKCPLNFFCCKDNCFKHRICKEVSSTNGSDIKSSRIREVCPDIPEACLLPADIKNAVFCTDNCTSGLKCCPDHCFKQNVCKKPDVIIEARVEVCPEEPKSCNSFLREMKIEPKYICNVNMSNCPEDYKCCSDNCHNVNLCKTPDVRIVVKKLIPVTTIQNDNQNATGPVPGNPTATIPQPGNQNATSSQPKAQNTPVLQTPVSQPGMPNATSSQPKTQSTTVSQTTTSRPGNQNATTLQPVTQHTTVLQTSTLQPGNLKSTSAQPVTQHTTVLQTSTSRPGIQSTTVAQTSSLKPVTPTAPKLNDKNATSVQPLG